MTIIHLPALDAVDRNLVGGKAWSIAHMQRHGIPVPPAFVIGTDVCTRFYAEGKTLPGELLIELDFAMARLEQRTGKTFGKGPHPLLVSVRSGAATSMPGMMDTVLNLGMNADVEAALAQATGDPAFAADTHRRFIEQFTHVVGHAPPNDPRAQLHDAVTAVFASWMSERAIRYRASRGLDDNAGTAVTVQAMVFGNIDARSGTGVLFSRDPNTGERKPYGEWLTCGQGEEVVSGRRTPEPLSSLATLLPDVHAQLLAMSEKLEQLGQDVQDIEFTVEAGHLWLLQTRAAKRTPQAAIRLAVSLCEEGLISREQALQRITPAQLAAARQAVIDPAALRHARVLAEGKPACPGVVTGTLVTDVLQAEQRADAGESIILARPTTDPDDVHAMSIVAGVLTELGGSTSHAAVVSRELGVPCIVGCGAGSLVSLDGVPVTVDATNGKVHAGTLAIQPPLTSDSPDLSTLQQWARQCWGLDDGTTLSQALASRPSSQDA